MRVHASSRRPRPSSASAFRERHGPHAGLSIPRSRAWYSSAAASASSPAVLGELQLDLSTANEGICVGCRVWVAARIERGARASQLVFRAPLQRRFQLRNGVGTVRIVINKPLGTALPTGELRTRPADRDCRVTRSRVSTAGRRLTPTERVQCRGLPANARGVLTVGGLIAADVPAAHLRSSRIGRAAASAAASSISQGCEAPTRLDIGSDSVQWKQCFTGPFSLGPWQSQWVGHIGSTPQFNCEAAWVRRFGALDHPVLWALIGRFGVDLATDPRNAWAWSWRLGVVEHWQFSGDITFWWTYRCFQFNPPGPR